MNVLRAFPAEDHAKEIKDLDLGAEPIPTQRSLGLSWEVATDTFTFQASTNQQPFTQRGALSTVNSLFDPLGFVAKHSRKVSTKRTIHFSKRLG